MYAATPAPFPAPTQFQASAYLYIEPNQARMHILGASRELETTSVPWLLPGRNCPALEDAGLQQLPPLPANSTCRAQRGRGLGAQATEHCRPGTIPGSSRVPNPPHSHVSAFQSAHFSTPAGRHSQHLRQPALLSSQRGDSPSAGALADLTWASLRTGTGGTSGSCLIRRAVPHLQACHLCIQHDAERR